LARKTRRVASGSKARLALRASERRKVEELNQMIAHFPSIVMLIAGVILLLPRMSKLPR
jgi:hypothetical protein